jgi:hypothetical protein
VGGWRERRFCRWEKERYETNGANARGTRDGEILKVGRGEKGEKKVGGYQHH